MEAIIREIRQLVEGNRLSDALDLLLANVSERQQDEVRVLKRNLAGLEREKRIGAIDYREYTREAVKVAAGILDLTGRLKQ